MVLIFAKQASFCAVQQTERLTALAQCFEQTDGSFHTTGRYWQGTQSTFSAVAAVPHLLATVLTCCSICCSTSCCCCHRHISAFNTLLQISPAAHQLASHQDLIDILCSAIRNGVFTQSTLDTLHRCETCAWGGVSKHVEWLPHRLVTAESLSCSPFCFF